MLPAVFFCLYVQEQYQYLYKAMLSLVGNRECDLSPMNMDTNGVVVIADESDPAESMESLVWGHSYRHLICKNFSEAFFARLLIKWITLLLFILIKVVLILFLSFISCLKCYPAEYLHLFKLTWGKSSSVQFALYYQCYCLNPSGWKSSAAKTWHHNTTETFGPHWEKPEAWRPGWVTLIHL